MYNQYWILIDSWCRLLLICYVRELLIKLFRSHFKPKWLPALARPNLLHAFMLYPSYHPLITPLFNSYHPLSARIEGRKITQFFCSTATAVRWPCLWLVLLSQISRGLGTGGYGETKKGTRRKKRDKISRELLLLWLI